MHQSQIAMQGLRHLKGYGDCSIAYKYLAKAVNNMQVLPICSWTISSYFVLLVFHLTDSAACSERLHETSLVGPVISAHVDSYCN